MKCSNCGATVNPEAESCPECGAEFVGSERVSDDGLPSADSVRTAIGAYSFLSLLLIPLGYQQLLAEYRVEITLEALQSAFNLPAMIGFFGLWGLLLVGVFSGARWTRTAAVIAFGLSGLTGLSSILQLDIINVYTDAMMVLVSLLSLKVGIPEAVFYILGVVNVLGLLGVALILQFRYDF